MPTRIDGNSIFVPGYVTLENPLISFQTVLATDADGKIVSTNLPISVAELLASATINPTANTIPIRTPTGGIQAVSLRLGTGLDIEGLGEPTLNWTYDVGVTGGTFAFNYKVTAPYFEAVDGGTVEAAEMTATSEFFVGDLRFSVDGPDVLVYYGSVMMKFTLDGITFQNEKVRLKNGVMQLKCPDDSLFYDVAIRLVLGVSTLAVEGAGEA